MAAFRRGGGQQIRLEEAAGIDSTGNVIGNYKYMNRGVRISQQSRVPARTVIAFPARKSRGGDFVLQNRVIYDVKVGVGSARGR